MFTVFDFALFVLVFGFLCSVYIQTSNIEKNSPGFELANVVIISLKYNFCRSFSVARMAREFSLPCASAEHKYVFINLSLLKLSSALATVTGITQEPTQTSKCLLPTHNILFTLGVVPGSCRRPIQRH